MNHLTEEEWIEYYCGEGADRERVQRHIAECAQCAAAGQALARDLAEIRANADLPEPDSTHSGQEYGEKVWQALSPSLTPYPRPQKTRQKTRKFWQWPIPMPVLAAAMAALLITAGVAFYSGRWWQQKSEPQTTAANNAQGNTQDNTQVKERVILLVVGDHLDRTQRLLAELNDPEQAAADRGLQATARKLLTENRLYRQSAESGSSTAGDSAADSNANSNIDTMLDRLEPVLVELANQPDDLNSAEIVRLRKELNTGGLLFEIHVLRSKVRTVERTDSGTTPGGTA